MVKFMKKFKRSNAVAADPVSSPAMRDLVANLHYEIVPMKSIEQAIEDLPSAAHVSVTCSPAKGISGYPDGHAMIADDEITAQLHAKQAVLAEAGVAGWVSTQMCFDEAKIRSWLQTERAAGLHLPVRLGVPGVVDRARLMTMGSRLGIGASMRYLSKNRSTVMQLMAPGGFDPTDMVIAFADDAVELGIEALHSFTFNAVADTRAWQEAIVNGGSGG